MTFSACTPPLSEAVLLWDVFMAKGFHWSLLCVVAQVLLIRGKLMGERRFVFW